MSIDTSREANIGHECGKERYRDTDKGIVLEVWCDECRSWEYVWVVRAHHVAAIARERDVVGRRAASSADERDQLRAEVERARSNEVQMACQLSDALSGGNASTWDEILHAAVSLRQRAEQAERNAESLRKSYYEIEQLAWDRGRQREQAEARVREACAQIVEQTEVPDGRNWREDIARRIREAQS